MNDSVFSMAYRHDIADIRKGNPSKKYRRLLPLVPGRKVLEVCAAEGVLALMLAEVKDQVIALEKHPERAAEAVRLKERWKALGRDVYRCTMVHGDIRENLHLLEGVDTLISIRCIYYFGDEGIRDVFGAARSCGVPNIVLGGNAGRAQRYALKKSATDKDRYRDYYASVPAMKKVLIDHGYEVAQVINDGADPVVIGICP
jgi:cyclopropane fatty-acyl-phospholipid synthase-like methyltransferase